MTQKKIGGDVCTTLNILKGTGLFKEREREGRKKERERKSDAWAQFQKSLLPWSWRAAWASEFEGARRGYRAAR